MDNRIYMGLLILITIPFVNGCKPAAVNDEPEWSVAFSLPSPSPETSHLGLAGPLVGVHDGVLFIGGGANFPGGMPWQGNKKEYDQSVYAYSKKSDGQSDLLGVFQLPDSAAYSANCNTPHGVAVVGGENERGLSAEALLIAWDADAGTPTFQPLPELPAAITNASLAYLGNTLYLAGGEKQDSVSDQLLALDLSHPEAGWQAVSPLPYPVSHAALVAQQGNLYLMGGRKRNPGGVSDFHDEVWQFDVKTDTWIAKASLPKALSAATAVASGSSEVLLIGGDDGSTFLQVEGAIAAAANETDDQARNLLDQQKIALLENHPGFDGTVWRYQIEQNVWDRHSEIRSHAPVTTTATWWEGKLYVPSGEIRAGVRSPDVWVGEWSQTPSTQ